MKKLIIINYENQYLDKTFGDGNTFIADGLQRFLHECSKEEHIVVLVTSKDVEQVYEVANTYTRNHIDKFVFCKDDFDLIEAITELQEEYKINDENTLLITNSELEYEGIKIYEYSKDYCGNHIFNNYLQLLPLLEDEEVMMPSLQICLYFEVENEHCSDVIERISECSFEIEMTDVIDSNKTLIAVNRIEVECKEPDDNMYVETLMEEVLNLFFKKKKLLKDLQKEYECKITLSVVGDLLSSKVNPSLSPSKKIIKFLGDTNIDLDYDVYTL